MNLKNKGGSEYLLFVFRSNLDNITDSVDMNLSKVGR